MKAAISISIALLLLISGHAKAIDDAVILLNEEVHSYSISEEKGQGIFQHKFLVKRRIKINSWRGLEQFNTLYIPTYEDLDFTFGLLNLEAKTIKPDGTEITVGKEYIRETTLPANVPLSYGYEGKVKMLAFPALELNDEIEYTYEIVYRSNVDYHRTFVSNHVVLGKEFPIQKAVYRYHIGKDLTFEPWIRSYDAEFVHTQDGKTETYELNLSNLPAWTHEDYAVNADNIPTIQFRLYKEELWFVYTKWSELLDRLHDRPSKNSALFGGKTIGQMAEKAKAVEHETVLQKMEAVRTEFTDTYAENGRHIYSVYKYYYPTAEDLNQLIRLLKMIDVEGAILMVRDREWGSVHEDYVSIDQFNDFIIEFRDEGGKAHYWMPFVPFSKIDEIGYEYEGTKAFRVEGSRLNYSFVTVPTLNIVGESTTAYDLVIRREGDKINVNATTETQLLGGFAQDWMAVFSIQLRDSSLKFFSLLIENYLDDYHEDLEVDTIQTLELTDGLNYHSEYSYAIEGVYPENQFSFPIYTLLDNGFWRGDLQERERKTTADFGYAEHQIWTLNIKSADGFKFLNNQLINQSASNDIAAFESKCTINADGSAQLVFDFKLKKAQVLASEWTDLLAIYEEMQRTLFQRIVLEK